MAHEHLFAIEADLHRTIEQQRRFGDNDLVVEGVALAAEAAAVRRCDDANVCRRHGKRLCQRAVQVVRRLRARIDHELAVGILQRHGGVLLDRQVRAPLEEEHIVEHVVGGGDGAVDIPELERHRFVHVAVIAVVVDARLVVSEAVGRRRKGAQRLVAHLNQVDRVFGGDLVARDHGGDWITDEADLVAAEGVFVVADGQNAVGDRELLAGQHEVDTVDARGLRYIDADDASVGLRRAQQAAVQHPRQHDVVGKASLTGDLGTRVDATPADVR